MAALAQAPSLGLVLANFWNSKSSFGSSSRERSLKKTRLASWIGRPSAATPISINRRYCATVPTSLIPNALEGPVPSMFEAQTPLSRCFLAICKIPLYCSASSLNDRTSSGSTAPGGTSSVRVRRRIGAQALALSQVTGTRWEVGSSRSAPVKWKSGRKRAGNYRL